MVKKLANGLIFALFFFYGVCLDASPERKQLPTPLMINAALCGGVFDRDALVFNKTRKKTVIVHWRTEVEMLRGSFMMQGDF